MLQPWFHAKGLLKRFYSFAIRPPELHLLGDSGWSLRRCAAPERANGAPLSREQPHAVRTHIE
jgi:hypothetical protein